MKTALFRRKTMVFTGDRNRNRKRGKKKTWNLTPNAGKKGLIPARGRRVIDQYTQWHPRIARRVEGFK